MTDINFRFDVDAPPQTLLDALKTKARQLAQDNPKTNQNFTSATVKPLANSLIGLQFRQTVWAMLAAVILVLLIACVNVMNMQFGRAALRARELAIRGALGATRWRHAFCRSIPKWRFSICGSLRRKLSPG